MSFFAQIVTFALGIAITGLAYGKPSSASDYSNKKRSKRYASADNKAPKTRAKTKPQVARDSSSTSARSKKDFGLAAKYGTPGIGVLVPGGEILGIVNPSFQVGLSYYQGSMSADLGDIQSADSITKASASVNASAFFLGSRLFLGNSFFLGTSLGRASYSANMDLESTSLLSTSNYGMEVTAQTFLANAMIGNQWMFDNGLFITCEWIGYTVPFGGSYSASHMQSGAYKALSSEVLDSFADDLGNILTKTSAIAAMVSMGIAF